MSFVSVSRDSFARQDTVREQVDPTPNGCKWCGQLNGFGRLFRYGTQPDSVSGRVNWHVGEFCSKDCHDTYHEV